MFYRRGGSRSTRCRRAQPARLPSSSSKSRRARRIRAHRRSGRTKCCPLPPHCALSCKRCSPCRVRSGRRQRRYFCRHRPRTELAHVPCIRPFSTRKCCDRNEKRFERNMYCLSPISERVWVRKATRSPLGGDRKAYSGSCAGQRDTPSLSTTSRKPPSSAENVGGSPPLSLRGPNFGVRTIGIPSGRDKI